MDVGYTMLCEQTPSRQLVGDLVRAEETVGAERQGRFFEFAEAELLPALHGQ